MGQTLTHGIYLPDEGERNCYDGLAGNWQLLDGAVGTVAEHTTQIAGKAPLVHTHTKADITDFPAYGNAAGTICEGNDSRLSDARTPVAHTHTKSDVTDLLNSNFIPSANNSYDLGSSSYQWNNVYAKSYYYNGVAWGLDKANTWTGDNTYTKYQNIIIAGTEIGVAPNNQNRNGLLFKDKNNETLGWVRSVYDSTGDLSIEMLITNKYSNGALDPNGTQTYQGIKQTLSASGDVYFGWSGRVNNSVVPKTNNYYDLGTSSNKWKTLNGINPGALSLPSASYIDISSSITDRNYGANYYTAPSNGYVCIGSMASSLQISNDTLGFGTSGGTAQDGYSSVYIPVRTGDTVRILFNQTSTDYQRFRFYPCQGNV